MVSERIHVICFGNELHGDDGFGPAVHAHLAAAPLPAHVRLLRADIAGLAAIGCFEGCGRAIVVDALRGFGPAGSLHALDPAGFHGAGLGALLQLLPAALEQLPQIRLIGVEAARVAPFSPGLSACVAARVGDAAAHIREAWQ
ncbi:MAG: hydrogenase maturation protease [Zoogloea sp.]|uniref:hydrogenase maturation protease n=1 Tax=Zoogloea sp. TaxID=49181 RepID=UPI002613EDBA|nr:hydrogenase maturation protease [Zoogloea sp.]MDD3328188.1 hydrogenase maturation protease [Zoogloea sp.]